MKESTSPLRQLVARSSRASRHAFVFKSQQLQNVLFVVSNYFVILPTQSSHSDPVRRV